MEFKKLYIEEGGKNIYILDINDNVYLVARWENLSKKKIKEIVNDSVVPDEFYDDFQGTLEDAIDWLEQYRKESINCFEEIIREYTEFDYDIYDGNTKIVGRKIGQGDIENARCIEWEHHQKGNRALINAGVKFNQIRTVLDYYKLGE